MPAGCLDLAAAWQCHRALLVYFVVNPMLRGALLRHRSLPQRLVARQTRNNSIFSSFKDK